MKQKISIVLVLSCVQALLAASLLFFPSSLSAGSATAFCDNGCGACSIQMATNPACGASFCDTCWCTGWILGTFITVEEDCPGEGGPGGGGSSGGGGGGPRLH